MSRRTAVRVLVQIAVSAAFIGVLLWRGDLGDLARALRQADWGWVALAAALVIASKATHGVRWWLLVRRAGPGPAGAGTSGGRRVPLGGTVLILLAATGVSVILPLRAGAALQLQVLRRRYGVERAAVAGTLVLEGFLDAAAVLLLALALAPFLGLDRFVSPLVLAAGLALLAAGAAAATLLARRGAWRQLLARIPSRHGRQAVEGWAAGLGRGFAAAGSVPYLVLLLAVTLGDWALATAAYVLVGHGLDLGVPLRAYLAAEIIGNLSGAVPLTQANVGPYELAVRETLAAFGAEGNRAAAFAVAAHAAIITATAAAGLAAAWALRLGRDDLFYIHAEDADARDTAPAAKFTVQR